MQTKLQLISALLFISICAQSQTQIGSDIIGEDEKDNSGCSVSLSADGNILAIGARGNTRTNPALGGQGHVRVYENIAGNWQLLGGDIDGEAEGDQSGYSVSLSSDGSVVAIGAFNNNGNNGLFSGGGHVRIYEYNSGSWTLQTEIDGQSGDGSGFNVSLSGDGSTVAIGSIYNDEMADNAGAVRVYKNQSGIWIQYGGTINGLLEFDYFGSSVSLSNDGSILAVASEGIDQTHVYEYNVVTGGWSSLGAFIEGIGNCVTLSDDGYKLAVGNQYNNDNGQSAGQVRVYKFESGTWSQIGDNMNGEAGDKFGSSVAMNSDGSIIAVGAEAVNGPGSVLLLENIAGTWSILGQLIEGDFQNDYFGGSVSLSSNGAVVAIGADGNDANGDFSGHTKVFDMETVLGIAKPEISSAILLYPNPVSDRFSVELDDYTFMRLDIFNVIGEKVMTSARSSVDVSQIDSGSYYVIVHTKEGVGVQQIVID